MAQTARLNQFMSKQLKILSYYIRSNDGTEAKMMVMDPDKSALLKVPNVFFISMSQEFRGSIYTYKLT